MSWRFIVRIIGVELKWPDLAHTDMSYSIDPTLIGAKILRNGIPIFDADVEPALVFIESLPA
jgi:hypothetical protein